MKKLMMAVVVVAVFMLASLGYARGTTFQELYSPSNEVSIKNATKTPINTNTQTFYQVLDQAKFMGVNIDSNWGYFADGAKQAGMEGVDIYRELVKFVLTTTDVSSVSKSKPGK